MTLRPDLVLDESAFFAWLQQQERRHELVDGRPVLMTGATSEHAEIVFRLNTLLAARLPLNVWWVATSDFAVRVAPGRIRYPDIVVVERVAIVRRSFATEVPSLIVEVLSRSTMELDLGRKAHEYLGLPSLQAYLVFSEDRPAAHVWVRGEGGFPAGPVPVEGWRAAVSLPQLGLRVQLADVYRGILPAEDEASPGTA